MGKTADMLAAIRKQIDAEDKPLAEVRLRLAIVRTAALEFEGALSTYASGSLAAHTMNHPVTDGDGGLVLDRRCFPRLGPEGGGENPQQIVDALRLQIGPLVRETYPNARVGISKRGPKFTFGSPVNGQDPTVDLVVALTRREGSGLWIPNLKKGTWEPSHPEGHVALLNSGTPSHRSIRRKIIRLAKAWNKQYTEPGVSSFMLSVWAYEFVTPGMGVADGLLALFKGAAQRIKAHQATPDPVGVSANLKLLMPAGTVQVRLRKAAEGLQDALSDDSDTDKVASALAAVFPHYVTPPKSRQLAETAALLSRRTTIPAPALGVSGSPVLIPPTRSYGEA
ncbi:hypothetical protein [Glycomyces buryatensis]|uniref:Nucleotidyltransferase n=1 Tax=Glycomyces buryatensis TaxID=2570927 RepID=A0A4S8QE33_9ACTN|nr:hypothetical protein [Glycomyces buryatensis]THV41165.1 hypothetical protein FAB82_13015 [Glycomyces buryatensis]